jgi:putative oxidoreductase
MSWNLEHKMKDANERIARSAAWRARMAPWATLPLRLIVGYGFLAHGVAKIVKGPENFALILKALGTPMPELSAWLTIFFELLCGFAVLAGAFVPLLSIPMVVILLVAIFTVHLPYGFSSIKLMSVSAAGAHFGQPGYETDLLYIAGIAALVMYGSGPWSLDAWRARRARQG